MIHSRFSFGAHTQLTNRSGDNHRVLHQLDYFQEIALRQCFLQILNSSVRDRLLEATWILPSSIRLDEPAAVYFTACS